MTELTKSSGYAAGSAVNITGGTTGLSAPDGIAVDAAGNVWVANSGNNSVTE